MRDVFILNEIWTQDKTYISVVTLLGFNILFTVSLSTGSIPGRGKGFFL
jgi:hypothetical protein